MSGGNRGGGLVPGGVAALVGVGCLAVAGVLVDDSHPAAPIPLAIVAAALGCFGLAFVQSRRAKNRPSSAPRAAPQTILRDYRWTLLGLPPLLSVGCMYVVGSVAIHGIPSDPQDRVFVALAAAGAVATVIWLLRWRHHRTATLTVERDSIVLVPRGPRPQPVTIARRPDSRLQIGLAGDFADGPKPVSKYVLYDATVGTPRIPIDRFDIHLVKAACLEHGWGVAVHDEASHHREVPGQVTRAKKLVIAVFLIAAGILVDLGIDMVEVGHRGKTVIATIGSCEMPQATGTNHGGHKEVCQGTWTEVAPATGRQHLVHGTVESATYQDEGKQVEIVVAGGRGFSKSLASRLGYIALAFALLCLANAIMLLRSAWQTRRAGRTHGPASSA